MSGLRASMRLYGLVKNSGSSDNPQRQPVDILCMTNRTGGSAIRAFVSRLDAELMTRSAGLADYRVIPLRTFDPTAFIDAHQGWLTLHVCCGFVAPAGHSLLKDGGLMPMGNSLICSLDEAGDFETKQDLVRYFEGEVVAAKDEGSASIARLFSRGVRRVHTGRWNAEYVLSIKNKC